MIVTVAIGTVFTLLGLAFVQAATSCALRGSTPDRPRAPSMRTARRSRGSGRSSRPRARSVIWAALSMTVFPHPVAIWLAARQALLARSSCSRRGRSGRRPPPQRRARPWPLAEGRLARRRRRGARARGDPLLGALLIILTSAPLALLNVVAGIVYALALPFVALTTSYVYFDARVPSGSSLTEEIDGLPAEISLAAQ